MSDYRVYGLDEAGAIVWAERIGSQRPKDVLDQVRGRLSGLSRIEVWDGPVCVHRAAIAPPRTPLG